MKRGDVRWYTFRAPDKRRPVLILIDADVIAWFKARGDGYQTRINAALRAYIEQHRHG